MEINLKHDIPANKRSKACKKSKAYKVLKNTKGQSSLEFLFAFIFSLGFFIFFIRLAILYTNGYLVQYATFMASRAYMVKDSNENDPSAADNVSAKQAATDALKSFSVGTFLSSSFSSSLKFNHPDLAANNYDRNLLVGASTFYNTQINNPVLNLGNLNLHLTSESFLGREVNRAECIQRTCYRLKKISGISTCKNFVTVVDNGC